MVNAASETGESTLADAQTDITTAMTASGRTFKCPKCLGVGTHALSKDTGNPADTQQIVCTLAIKTTSPAVICSGWGQLIAAVRMIPSNQFELV